MRKSKLSRREREKLAHRKEILAAAERVFSRDGYGAATVERIALEADFAVGSLYNFFDSKEKLFDEVIAGLAGEVFQTMQKSVFAEKDPEKALAALIDLRLRFPQEHRQFCRMFFEAAPLARCDIGRSWHGAMDRLYQRYLRSVTALVRRGIAAGVLRKQDPRYTVLCMEGAFRVIGIEWIDRDPGGLLEGHIRKVKEILLAMLRSGRERAS